MKISTKGRYALRVMIDLALHSDGAFVSLKDIAIRQEISNKYLEQIISLLNKAGYLESARGNTGGYKLTKKPSEYVIGDILRATEGDLSPIFCLTDDGGCSRKENCKTFSFWQGLDNVIAEYVDSKTLEDLIK
jgi:Rrf2 family protein